MKSCRGFFKPHVLYKNSLNRCGIQVCSGIMALSVGWPHPPTDLVVSLLKYSENVLSILKGIPSLMRLLAMLITISKLLFFALKMAVKYVCLQFALKCRMSHAHYCDSNPFCNTVFLIDPCFSRKSLKARQQLASCVFQENFGFSAKQRK